MKKILIISFLLVGCINDPDPSNDFLTNPVNPPKEQANVKIVASDVRLYFPNAVEIYVKVINYGPDDAYNVKASMNVYAYDTLHTGTIVMLFRNGDPIIPYEFEKRTLRINLDNGLNMQDSSDVTHGPIVLTWDTK
jgi:hypothetical protein